MVNICGLNKASIIIAIFFETKTLCCNMAIGSTFFLTEANLYYMPKQQLHSKPKRGFNSRIRRLSFRYLRSLMHKDGRTIYTSMPTIPWISLHSRVFKI
jgi:hypothetical protein